MSGFYNLGLQDFTKAVTDLTSATIKVRLSRASAYTFAATHTTMTSIGTGVGTDPTLGTKSCVDGTFDAADSLWTAVASGAAIDQLVVYKFITNDAGSTPIAFINGFSVTPNGGDITAVWQATSPFIFKI